jgi:ribonuclease-3 family protein
MQNLAIKMQNLVASMTASEARLKNPLHLAYVGDTVYDLILRTDMVLKSNESISSIHNKISSKVNAKEQSNMAGVLEPRFTEEESYIFKRGRNAKSGHAPKNMDVQDYRRATGLEAVIGFLFLTGNGKRINELFETIMEKEG